MIKYCYNYDSGEYEYIDKDGFSWTQGQYVYNWDDSEYKREEEWDNYFSDDKKSKWWDLFDDDDE